MLESSNVVEKTVDELQEEYIESVIGDQLLAAYENGPIFESVSRSDKDDVKKIVQELRPKIKDALYDAKITFYKPNLVARALTGALTFTGVGGIFAGNAGAALHQIWSTRLWQVLGICIIEAGNIQEVVDTLNNKFKDSLGEYKVLQLKTVGTLTDVFRVKFNWKNDKNAYFLLIDKKIPKELKEFNDAIDKAEPKNETIAQQLKK